MQQPFYFTAQNVGDGEILEPQDIAASNWAERQTVRGMATSAAMARAAEQAATAAGLVGLRPVRWTADLSRPVPMGPLVVKAQMLRSGRRLALVDVELVAQERVAARARALFLKDGGEGLGKVWAPPRELALPPEGLEPTTREPRLYFSADVGWTPDAGRTGTPRASRSGTHRWPSSTARHSRLSSLPPR